MKSQHRGKPSHDSRPSNNLFWFTLWPNSQDFYFSNSVPLNFSGAPPARIGDLVQGELGIDRFDCSRQRLAIVQCLSDHRFRC